MLFATSHHALHIIYAAVKAIIFDWSAEPTFLRFILVFVLVVAAIQTATDSVLIVLQCKASKVRDSGVHGVSFMCMCRYNMCVYIHT